MQLIFPVHQLWAQKRLFGNLTSTKIKMKKFLAFLLIAKVSCTTVEGLNFELRLDGIVDFFKRVCNWLKENGVLDLVKDTFWRLGKKVAINLCSK